MSLQTGTRAFFAVRDVLCPTSAEVLRSAGPELAIQGRIMYLSDCGERRGHFAVIDVCGIHAPLIVPVDRLRLTDAQVDDASLDEQVTNAQVDDLGPSERLAASG